MDHAYHLRVTNEGIIERVEIMLNKGEDLDITWDEFMRANDMAKAKHFTRLSETVMRRQNTMLAHMIKADATDLLRGLTMTDGLQQWARSPKRAGLPRVKWMAANYTHYAGEVTYTE